MKQKKDKRLRNSSDLQSKPRRFTKINKINEKLNSIAYRGTKSSVQKVNSFRAHIKKIEKVFREKDIDTASSSSNVEE